MALIYAEISNRTNSLWSILLLPVALLVIRYGVIEREERYLERVLGEEYSSYKTWVQRWIQASSSIGCSRTPCEQPILNSPIFVQGPPRVFSHESSTSDSKDRANF